MVQPSTNWIIITASYPPDLGGIADYSALIAAELAEAGDLVHVITGPTRSGLARQVRPGVMLSELPTHFSPASLSRLERLIRTVPEPRRLLVQYNPQPFGPRGSSRFKGLPLPFCYWARNQRLAPIWSIIHETGTVIDKGVSWRSRTLHFFSQRMLSWILDGSERAYYVMPAAEPVLRRHRSSGWLGYLPVPSNLPLPASDEDTRHIRRCLMSADERWIVGHFGAFSLDLQDDLRDVLERLLRARRDIRVLLIGQGSAEFAQQLPNYDRQVSATGALAAERAASHIAACDLLVQPYPDGVSTRRSSAMAAIALGVPVVSNPGPATEDLWASSRAVELAVVEEMPDRIGSLLIDRRQRDAMSDTGRRLYQERFAVANTIQELRGTPPIAEEH